MPPMPSVPNVIKLELRYADLHDSNIVNRLFWRYDSSGGAPTNGDLATWLGGVSAAYTAAPCTTWKSSSERLTELVATDLSSPTGAVASLACDIVGLATGSPMGAAICFLASFLIARRYRGGHPRMYISGPTSISAGDAETLTPAATSGVQTDWTDFFSAVSAVPVYADNLPEHVNVSFYSGFTNFTYPSGRTYPRPTLRETPLVDTVTGLVVSNKFASQRRRMVRGS